MGRHRKYYTEEDKLKARKARQAKYYQSKKKKLDDSNDLAGEAQIPEKFLNLDKKDKEFPMHDIIQKVVDEKVKSIPSGSMATDQDLTDIFKKVEHDIIDELFHREYTKGSSHIKHEVKESGSIQIISESFLNGLNDILSGNLLPIGVSLDSSESLNPDFYKTITFNANESGSVEMLNDELDAKLLTLHLTASMPTLEEGKLIIKNMELDKEKSASGSAAVISSEASGSVSSVNNDDWLNSKL